MANQAALTAETIAGLRRTTGRDHYSSESDDTIQRPTNRGGKLKRKAEYVHEGQLDRPNGLKVYKRRITHAGYQRTILKRNPKRYDEDGDELEDDDVDEEADADAIRRNPYSHIRIEELLAPLTSASDLPTHPSLSMAYRSKILTNMANQACTMLHREKKALEYVRNLLTKLRGDESYIPCGALNSEIDSLIFSTEPGYKKLKTTKLHIRASSVTHGSSLMGKPEASISNETSRQDLSGSADGHQSANLPGATEPLNLPPQGAAHAEQKAQDGNVANMVSVPEAATVAVWGGTSDEIRMGIGKETEATRDATPGDGNASAESAATHEGHLDDMNDDRAVIPQSMEGPPYSSAPIGAPSEATTAVRDPSEKALPSPESLKDNDEADAGGAEDNTVCDGTSKDNLLANTEAVGDEGSEETKNEPPPPPHRMTTRAQAQAASENSASSRTRSASPVSWTPPVIHPLYQLPESAYPDRDLGLPAHEAEETRRMLTAYVQKQEEVVRGAAKLYDGLLKADRMRQTVFKWCKADGHVGEMSDGEDWYDKEYWGLDEDLRKGHDDEEDEVAAQGKKTRKTRAQ